MTILNRIKSNWSFEERERLNQNWTTIENYLSNLQGQINLLTGEVDVQAIIDQLNDILNQGDIIITDLEAALNDATTVITNAQNATDDANNAAQEAVNAIANIQNIIDNFGSKGVYDNGITYSKNNIAYDDGCSYIYINATPSAGNPPPPYPVISNDHWHRLADKGASGSGAVSKVNGKEPNGVGEVTLTPSDIGAASSENLTGLQQTVTEHFAEFAQNLTPSGYQKLPNGLVLQWFRIPQGTPTTIDGAIGNLLPIEFNSASFVIFAQSSDVTTVVKSATFNAVYPRTNYLIVTNIINATLPCDLYVFALGV